MLLATLLVLTNGVARARDVRQEVAPPRPAPSGPQARINFSLGKFEGRTYSNDFFGISFTLPEGWVAHDVATSQELIDSAKKTIEEGSGEKKKAGIDASLSRSFFLLSASKYDLKKPGPGFNAQLSCMAERVPTAIVKSGADYIDVALKLARGTGLKVELAGPIRNEKVDGVSFAAVDVKVSMGAGVVAEKYYVTIRRGYAIMFSYGYVDEPDLKAFDEILKTMRFK
jgi:hypothetical protein